MLVSRWHYKHRCFDLPHTGYLISLGAAPRCFHRLNLSSSCLFSCLARKINILYMYITLWLEWFSVCFNWLLIPWTVHIWVFLSLLFVWPCGVLAFVCVGCDVIASARGDGEGSRLSGPGVWVSGWHDLLPASWQLLGLLPLSQGDTHKHKRHLFA